VADALGELMRSPLDELPGGPRPRTRLALAAGAAALLAAVVTLGIARAMPEDDASDAATIATIPAPPPPPPHGLPPGYIDIGTGYGIRVEWMMQLSDRLLVGISSALADEIDPGEVRPIGTTILGPTRRAVGAWTLRLGDGRAVAHQTESLDHAAVGMLTVSFPVTGLAAGDVAALEIAPAAGAGMRVEETRLPVDGLPVDIGDLEVEATELIESDSGTRSGESRLVVDGLQVSPSSGWIDWHLEGIEGVGARLEALITLVGDAVAEPDRAVLVMEIDAGNRFLQREPAPLTPGTSGSVHLVRARGVPAYEVTALEITWTVTWARYADEVIEVPLDGASWITGG